VLYNHCFVLHCHGAVLTKDFDAPISDTLSARINAADALTFLSPTNNSGSRWRKLQKTSVALCPDATRRLLLAARHGATRALFNSFARTPAAERVEVAAIVVLSGNRQSTPASFSFNNVTR
jgi:hypothetical protein